MVLIEFWEKHASRKAKLSVNDECYLKSFKNPLKLARKTHIYESPFGGSKEGIILHTNKYAYKRYIDDTFTLFCRSKTIKFFEKLFSLHFALNYTSE